MHSDNHESQGPQRFWRSRYALGLVVIGGIAAYFLFEEHRAHLFGAFSYLILLACPLMHFFMHRGHGGHHHHQDKSNPNASSKSDSSQPGGQT